MSAKKGINICHIVLSNAGSVLRPVRHVTYAHVIGISFLSWQSY